MKKTISLVLVVLSVLLLIPLTFSCKGKESINYTGDVYIYNFGEYLSDEAIDVFEKETGIKIHEDVFEANEEVLPVIESGANYDVICISDYCIERMLKKDFLLPLDLNKIPNYVNINKKQLELLSVCDPGNKVAVPYFRGGMGIAYRKSALDALGVAYPTKWSDLFNEKLNKEVIMQSSIRDLYTVGLKMNGFSANSSNKAEIEKVTKDFIGQKKYVQAYLCDQIKDKFLADEVAIAPITSGDMQIILLECNDEEAKDYGFIIPEEGTCLFIDAWCILKNAKNVENAYKFIDYMCREDVAKLNAEYIGYESVNDKTPDKEFLRMHLVDGIYHDYSKNNNELERDVGDAMRYYTDGYNELKAS